MNSGCRLCGSTTASLLNSHIIPEFLYKPLYDEKHRFNVLSDVEDRPKAKMQKGVREKLLCSSCEGLIGTYERYASLAFAGNAGLQAARTNDMVLLSGIDYEKFKLFALSILWRASVSRLSMFEQVRLGPHENAIRTMILEGDAGRQYRYPILLTQIVHENRMQEDLIVAPTWAKCAGHKAYRFVFYGLAWIFLVSNHRAPRFVDEAAISEQGTARLLISEIRDMPFLRDYLVRVFNQGQGNGAAR